MNLTTNLKDTKLIKFAILISIIIIIIILFFVSGKIFSKISNNQNKYQVNKTSDKNVSQIYPEIKTITKEQGYQEIETALVNNNVEDMALNPNAEIDKEIKRLRENGQIFWYDQNRNISKKTPMYHLQNMIECEKEIEEKCLIAGLTAYLNHYPPEYKLNKDECDTDGWCQVIEPAFQKKLANSMKRPAEFYGFGKDIYMAGSIKGDGDYSVFKNVEKLFSHKMNFGAESVFEETDIVLNSPAFTFYDQKKGKDENNPVNIRNIWYKGETLNEKYGVESSSYLFSYKDKTGFVGENIGKKFFFFNGQKISQDFDVITTHACCSVFPYPIEIDENGILFFMAKRGEKYFFVEINLNKYLE